MRISHFIGLILILLSLSACKINEPVKIETNTENKIPEIEFTDVFGKPDNTHLWCYAKDVNFNVDMPKDVQKLTIYCRYFGHIYKLFELREPSQNERIHMNVPIDLKTFDMVIDRYVYVADGTRDIDARNTDDAQLVDSWLYMYETTLGWIMAADCAVDPDYDFNDLVALFEPTFDRATNITALCSGATEDMWLHYYDGTIDYIISPFAENGYCIPTKDVTKRLALKYSWLNWFDKDGTGIGTGFTINTSGKGNVSAKGATVRLPYEITNGMFNATMLSISTLNYKDKIAYAQPAIGFYVTVGIYDINKYDEFTKDLEEKPTMAESLMCIWPRGEQPQMIVIPDASELDTEYSHTGWQWPTEGSRIDLVYGDFIEWVKNPKVNWFADEPAGWENQAAVIDRYDSYLYYGYYTRP